MPVSDVFGRSLRLDSCVSTSLSKFKRDTIIIRASDFPLVHERDTITHDFITMSLRSWLKTAPPLAPDGPCFVLELSPEERARLMTAELPEKTK